MKLPANIGGDFMPPPAGTHVAVCYRVIDIGTQKVEWQGQTKFQRKIMLSWELTDEKMEDGQPFSVHQRYTLSSHEKALLRHHLEAWRGQAFTDAEFGPEGTFDIKNLLGKACLLGLVHQVKEGKTYANIASIMKLPKGQKAPAPINAPVYFSLDEFEPRVFDALSEGLRKIIALSPEYAEATKIASTPSHDRDEVPMDDEIPF